MKIHILVGAHHTAAPHIRQTLEANRALLAKHGTHIPKSDVAEKAVWGAIKAVRKNKVTDDTGKKMMSQLVGNTKCKRILLIRHAMSGSALRPIKNEVYYPRGSATLNQLTGVLDNVDVRVFMATRNPASFLPACYFSALRDDPKLDFAEFASRSNTWDLRWSEYMHRLQGKDANVPLTTWAFEDYPQIWRSVLAAFAGLPNKEDLVGGVKNLDPGLSLRGSLLLHRYLEENNKADKKSMAKVLPQFEQRFPRPEREVVPNVWPGELVTHLTHAYEDDLYYIDRMDNVSAVRQLVHA